LVIIVSKIIVCCRLVGDVIQPKEPKIEGCKEAKSVDYGGLTNGMTLEFQIYYINSGFLCVRLSDTTILHFNSSAELASAFSMAEPACGSW
jgi:hypothetical protein